ncbi:MAG TPA: S8 family serine peptidase, partial [Chitinophagaceae bacterium]
METIENNNNLLSRIVIKFRDSFYLAHYEPEAVSEFFCENNVIGWNRLLTQFHGIAVNNLFTSIHPTRIIEIVEKAKKLDSRYCPPAFLSYYAIDCPEKANVELLLKQLHQEQNVELAYIETGMTIPQALFLEETPFTLWPDHLKPAPVGIDVKYAWSIKGGDGEGRVKFIDIEQGWILDCKNLSISTIPNTGIIQQKFRDHGTAVLSLVAQNGEIGETGITPRANVYVVSQWRPDGAPNTADAIMTAIDNLSFGDIILLEAQVFDPSESLQLWPVEIQEAIFQVIRLATAAGITVVEAAGNGNF